MCQVGPLWCRPGLKGVTITVSLCQSVCLSDKKRDNQNLHLAPIWLELLFSYKRGRGMRQRKSSRMILLLGEFVFSSSLRRFTDFTGLQLELGCRYAQYGYWDKRLYLFLFWFWRLIIVKWCHLLNPRDCSTCFITRLHPRLHSLYPHLLMTPQRWTWMLRRFQNIEIYIMRPDIA